LQSACASSWRQWQQQQSSFALPWIGGRNSGRFNCGALDGTACITGCAAKIDSCIAMKHLMQQLLHGQRMPR